jgi:hypothetical protein
MVCDSSGMLEVVSCGPDAPLSSRGNAEHVPEKSGKRSKKINR